MKKILPYLFATVLAAFGLLTLFLSTSVIFDWFGIRAKEGNYVLFVVWSNFISSILYLIAAYGFVQGKKWTIVLLGISTLILVAAFIGLKIHVSTGGIYETKTVGAMIFRISVTFVFAILAMILHIAAFVCIIFDQFVAVTNTTRMGYGLSYHVGHFVSSSLTFQPLSAKLSYLDLELCQMTISTSAISSLTINPSTTALPKMGAC